MQPLFKTLVFLLLAAMITAPLAAQDLRPDVSSHQRPAGCHDDGNIPVPGPTSHSCCQSGHDVAMLPQASCLDLSSQAAVPLMHSERTIVFVVLSGFSNLAIVSGDPPVTSPLRI
jgi:hypothetical protein